MSPRVDQPVAGFYRRRLVKNGPWVAVLIVHGRPRDPVTGEELDRSPRWQAWLDGKEVDVFQVWPECSGAPIDKAEYLHLRNVSDWAREHAPYAPEAQPRQSINHNKLPPIF